ncbi:MAG: YifB family Mg chelatase-like AAA ATPase [Thalassobaculaceae bacterium]|nr:YifB family Mg chelatase-like AAA ATPase [Thalassobaculaceae bacterium]
MAARVTTVAFRGIETMEVDVQVHVGGGGWPGVSLVGLADKAVTESRERVVAALSALGLALPPKRITVNLAPADLPKEGGHFDLPVALGILVAMGALSAEDVADRIVLGELALDGRISSVAGVLPAAVAAAGSGRRGVICPAACGSEARWAEGIEVIAAPDLLSLLNHLRGVQVLPPAADGVVEPPPHYPDLRDVKGQESAKRALEVVAAGNHNLLMVGPPGAGKSMMAARLPGLLPPLTPVEALEVSMIRSVAGVLREGRIERGRPFRDPHHSASAPALIGGGVRAKPGEVSLAHRGVLFLDELAEFPRPVLDALRQPIETGEAVIARANHHVTYPARFQLVAAMNPCRCGHMADPSRACARAPRCGGDYQNRLSGPLLDRFDLTIEVQAVSAADLSLPPPAEDSAAVAARVAAARELQAERYRRLDPTGVVRTNADANGELLTAVAEPDPPGRDLMRQAAEKLRLSARGYHRVLKVARTLADLDRADTVGRVHVAEALAYRGSNGG